MEKNYVIVHGQLYAVPNDPNELQHWKYVKREKKNGRWVYYYDDNNEINNAKEDHVKAVTEHKVNTVKKKVVDALPFSDKTKSKTNLEYESSKNRVDVTKNNIAKVTLKHEKLVKPIAEGMAYIANIFSNMFSKSNSKSNSKSKKK